MSARLPAREPLVDGSGRLRLPWIIYFRDQGDVISNTPQRTTTPVDVSGSSAAIGTTAIPTDALAPGLYRVTWYLRVTGAAGVSSSVTVTIAWTDESISCSASGPAVTGNTVATTQSGTLMVRVDQSTPVSYATAYASNPAAAMTYDLVIVLESVDA